MRKLLIVPVGKVEQHHQMASDNNISEIVEGIPKSLYHLYSDGSLPIIHIEEDEVKPLTELGQLKLQLDKTNEAIDFLLMGGM